MANITRNVLSGAIVGALSGLTPYKLDKNIIYSVAIGACFGLLKWGVEDVVNRLDRPPSFSIFSFELQTLSTCATIGLIPEIAKRVQTQNWLSPNISYGKSIGFVALVEIGNHFLKSYANV